MPPMTGGSQRLNSLLATSRADADASLTSEKAGNCFET